MLHQMPDPGGAFERSPAVYLNGLLEEFGGTAAKHPTSHQLIREYVAGVFAFATRLHAASPEGLVDVVSSLANGSEPEAIVPSDPRYAELKGSILMDFGNYTIGGLFEDRRNYDDQHAGYQSGIAQVRGRIWELKTV